MLLYRTARGNGCLPARGGCNTYDISYPDRDTNAYIYYQRDSDFDPHHNPLPHTHANSHANCNPNCDGHAHSHPYRNANTNQHGHTYPYGNEHAHPRAHGYPSANQHAYDDLLAHRNLSTVCDPDPNTHGRTHPDRKRRRTVIPYHEHPNRKHDPLTNPEARQNRHTVA